MVSYRLAAVAGLMATVYALPLNINLGAYSPALVVGDGEISFGGNQDVTNLMNALEGAAVNAAGGAGGAGRAEGAVTPPARESPAASVPALVATATATVAAPPAGETGATNGVITDARLQGQGTSTLQGMGKEIAPREPVVTEAPKAKRDLAGFDRALKFAEVALTKGPLVQLGTGEKGAGVGIIVDNRPPAAAPPAGGAGGEGRREGAVVGKREDSSSAATLPRRRTKVTTMYVRRGVPASLQSSAELSARAVTPVVIPVGAAPVAKREESTDAKRDTVDAINLNVADPQGVTMTFVETTEDEVEQ